ncbi:hypothetical protein M9H77_23296 [Catharanthus roseus]|uniref:Uncharacterized protein n=1 Tax=Catharanthus roseus TaxID=4058 RepID=A0ACC0ASL1_CATRO|nr:hypothetical protein M9H77_23296 [Catharanthus roseus]
MKIILNLFNNIGWVPLLTVNELFYPEMIYEFYANLYKGRVERVGNVPHQWVLSRVGGRDIAFDDRLLNNILETPQDGIRFYIKNKKCYDANLYSERRFEEIFTKGEENEFWFYGHRAYASHTIIIHQMFVIWLLPYEDLSIFCTQLGGQDKSDEDNEDDERDKEQEEMNVEEDESEKELEEETHRREMRRKKRQERTEEGQSSVDMAQLMPRIITMQSQLNNRLDDIDRKLHN